MHMEAYGCRGTRRFIPAKPKVSLCLTLYDENSNGYACVFKVAQNTVNVYLHWRRSTPEIHDGSIKPEILVSYVPEKKSRDPNGYNQIFGVARFNGLNPDIWVGNRRSCFWQTCGVKICRSLFIYIQIMCGARELAPVNVEFGLLVTACKVG